MDIKTALKEAMKSEIEGRELYKLAAERTTDTKAKDVFTFLAEEENNHFETLKSIYNTYIKENSFTIPKIKPIVKFKDAQSPIFSRDFKQRLEGKHFEMSALSIALKLEKDSYEYYSKLAEDIDDPVLKDFFSYLSSWEKNHYDALYDEIQFLEEEYFSQNHFAPFL